MKTQWLDKALAGAIAAMAAAPAWPLAIQSPSPGELVSPGQTVWLIVQPSSPAERDIQIVRIMAPGARGCEDVQPSMPVQCPLTIPDGSDDAAIPTAVDIRVQVTFADGTEAQAKTNVTVTETRSLQALEGDPRASPLVFDAIGQERDLPVFGVSIDGAMHDLRGRHQGTVYDISDPAVVTVRNDGRVVSKAAGTATITVRNGALAFDVPVIVRRSTAHPPSSRSHAQRSHPPSNDQDDGPGMDAHHNGRNVAR